MSDANLHMRAVDLRRDLDAVADLIDTCFSTTMDKDGRDYVRYIRRMANYARFLGQTEHMPDRYAVPLNGWVWEEDGFVIGNLTLIPHRKQGKRVMLIANVAVLPEFRRKGIGRALTEQGIAGARAQGVDEVWLQVRDDNPAAEHLYRELGFIERMRRTTWLAEPEKELVRPQVPQVRATNRKNEDWLPQKDWLEAAYPADAAWNLGFNADRLKPGIIPSIKAILGDLPFRCWSARWENRLLGVATWEPFTSPTDPVWLAAPPESEDAAIRVLLPEVEHALRRRRKTLTVNYPAGRGVDAFQATGWRWHNTLIWMEIRLHPATASSILT